MPHRLRLLILLLALLPTACLYDVLGSLDSVDAGGVDGGNRDAGRPDAGRKDGGADAGRVDAGISDAGHVDAGVADAGPVDAGTVDAGCRNDSDCPERANQFCEVSAGQCVACLNDNDCPSGQMCTNSTCASAADAGEDGGQTTSWSLVPSGTTADLTGVVALDNGEAWAVGTTSSAGVMLQFSMAANAWSLVPDIAFPALFDVSGALSGSTARVWAVGPSGVLVELDETSTWKSSTPFGSDDEWAVWAVSPTEAWAVGVTSSTTVSVWHLSGGAWTPQVAGLGSAQIFYGIWAAGPTVVWAGGADESNNALMATWTPSTGTWATTTGGLIGTMTPSGFGGTSASDIWVATADSGGLAHWNGSSWTVQAEGMQMTSIWATSPTSVWAVGFGGTIMHWDGTAWTAEVSGTTADLNAIRGNATTLWVVGTNGTILSRAL